MPAAAMPLRMCRRMAEVTRKGKRFFSGAWLMSGNLAWHGVAHGAPRLAHPSRLCASPYRYFFSRRLKYMRSMPLAAAAREMFPSCLSSWPWR